MCTRKHYSPPKFQLVLASSNWNAVNCFLDVQSSTESPEERNIDSLSYTPHSRVYTFSVSFTASYDLYHFQLDSFSQQRPYMPYSAEVDRSRHGDDSRLFEPAVGAVKKQFSPTARHAPMTVAWIWQFGNMCGTHGCYSLRDV